MPFRNRSGTARYDGSERHVRRADPALQRHVAAERRAVVVVLRWSTDYRQAPRWRKLLLSAHDSLRRWRLIVFSRSKPQRPRRPHAEGIARASVGFAREIKFAGGSMGCPAAFPYTEHGRSAGICRCSMRTLTENARLKVHRRFRAARQKVIARRVRLMLNTARRRLSCPSAR